MTYDKSVMDSLNPDICLFTHGHADHFRKRVFKKLDTKLFAPGPLKMRLSKKRKISLEELNSLHPDFSVKYFKTPHGFSLKHYSYLIEWKGKRIYLSGDTHDKEHLLNYRIEDSKVGSSIRSAARNPLPAHSIIGQACIHECIPKPGGSILPRLK